jgi:hypothetical protein
MEISAPSAHAWPLVPREIARSIPKSAIRDLVVPMNYPTKRCFSSRQAWDTLNLPFPPGAGPLEIRRTKEGLTRDHERRLKQEAPTISSHPDPPPHHAFFFGLFRIVSGLISSTFPSSTTRLARSRRDHRKWPLGGFPRRMAINWLSCRPFKVFWRGGFGGAFFPGRIQNQG